MPPSSRIGFILVLSHAVLVQILTYAIRPTISYGILEAGGSPALLGVAAAAFALPSLALALPTGHILDRIGEKPGLIIGPLALIAAAGLALMGHASVPLLLLATVILGIGHLTCLVAQQTAVANRSSRARGDSLFGLYTFAASAGQTIGPLLLGLPGGTPETPPIQLIFLLCTSIACVMLALALFMTSSIRQPLETRPSMLKTAAILLRTRGVPRALIATSVVLAAVDIFLTYAPALGHERGLSATVVGIMLAARSILSMFSRLFLGSLVRLIGRRRLVVWSIALSAVSLACFVFPLPELWLIALAAVFGFVVGICQPITMSWISELAPPGTRGLAMSMRLAANRLGQTVLPAVLGAFATATGAAGVLVATSVFLGGATWSSSAIPDSERERPYPDDAPA